MVIKQDLQSLSADLDTLQDYVIRNRSGKSQTDSHSDNIVMTLKGEIANTTKQFAEVLQVRSSVLKQQSDRRKQFSTAKTMAPRTQRPRFAAAAAMDPEESQPLMHDEYSNGSSAMMELEQKDMSNEYLESRAEAVEQIEKTIHELSQMYQRLATIVSMQGETVLRIDADMESAVDNVNRGHAELLKFYETASNNRWLILKVFLTLILFAIFFIVFVA